MDSQAQFGISPSADAQLEPETQPRASEDTDSRKGSVRVQVHDASTPLLQQPNGGSDSDTLQPSAGNTDPPGEDNRSWRRKPSVS